MWIGVAAASYLALLGASHIVQRWVGEPEPTRPFVHVAERRGGEPAPDGGLVRMTYMEWAPAAGTDSQSDEQRPTIILLHGSPGDASNFDRLGPLLASAEGGGWRTIALDLPGFGQSGKWVDDYSIRAHGAYAIELMDRLGIDRAHVVGWSMGGGVALHMAGHAPDRLASVTLMASIGTQESEGSGSYWFEHLKYAVGYAALVVGGEIVPHFGLLGPSWLRHSTMRNFWDTDQRELRPIMERLDVPTLVLHGRNDVLAGVRGAEEAAAIIPDARLVITDDNHFLPIMSPGETADRLAWFLARHDTPGRTPLAGEADLAPSAERKGAARFIERLGQAALVPPWLVVVGVIGLLARREPRGTTALCALPVAAMSLDFGVATAGLLAGWMWRDRHERRSWGWVRLALWIPFCLGLLVVAAAIVGSGAVERLSWIALGLFVVLGGVLIGSAPHVWTWRGRQRLRAAWSRLRHHEWWPAAVFYLPMWPWWAWLSIRHGGPLVFTHANPGIPGGGGIIGESKSQILESVGDRACILPTRLVPAGDPPESRARAALDIVEQGGDFALPVVLKPDMAFRGFAMRIARTRDDVLDYFRAVHGPVIVQKFHPGPEEVGLFWIRTPGAERAEGRPAGRIFAVTRKRFPIVEGDGRSSLERLILLHPRLRCQWRVFFARHRRMLDAVPGRGERIRLAQAGNHAQGTLFLDGADLITPELEEAVDRICDSYRGPGGEPFDFGRMDVRYESDERLMRGEGFGIVEINGSTSEATNLYDPSFSIRRSYAVLMAQWQALYRLGAWRRAQGKPGVGLAEIFRHWIEYRRQRSGSEVAD